MIESYQTGKGGKMVLVRNPKWNQASDPVRTPYPDKWEVDFGIDPKVIDQRLIQSSGPDATAISLERPAREPADGLQGSDDAEPRLRGSRGLRL